MGRRSFVIGLFHVASTVAIGLAAGCSGSSGDGSAGSGTPETRPVQAASAQGQTPPPSGSGGATPLPKQCAAEQDCSGACPPEAKGCACADAPDGKRCLPTCTADADCPTLPGSALVCSPQKVCMPKS